MAIKEKLKKNKIAVASVIVAVVVISFSLVLLNNNQDQTGFATNSANSGDVADTQLVQTQQSVPISPMTVTLSVNEERDVYGRSIKLISSTGSQILLRVGSITTFMISGQNKEMDGLKITASVIAKDYATLDIE